MLEKYIKKLNIGTVEVKNNVFLGPMAGVTDIAFRTICRKFGPPGLTFTEMASSKAMEFNSKKTEDILKIPKEERPSAVQIFGSNSETIKNTILKLNDIEDIDIIDITMGCPAPKLVKNGDGAGLLLDLNNIDKILKEAVKVSKKPITVKTRKGFNNSKITAVDVAKICENNGVKMITIHGRTREEYYSGKADLDIIAKVKQSVKIPVIGNGDIVDVNSALNMFLKTHVDGIMISRGAMGNPWIFKSILDGKDYNVNLEERFKIINEHIDLMCKTDGEILANLKLRKHISWYLKGLKGSTSVRNDINKASSVEEVKTILQDYYNFLSTNFT